MAGNVGTIVSGMLRNGSALRGIMARSAEIALHGAGRLMELIKSGKLQLSAEESDILGTILASAYDEAKMAGQKQVMAMLMSLTIRLKESGVI